MKILLVLLITAVAILGQESVIIKDIKTNKNILIGISNRKAYQDSNFASWFNAVYKNYDVDTNTIKEYKMGRISNLPLTARYAPIGASDSPSPKIRCASHVNRLV